MENLEKCLIYCKITILLSLLGWNINAQETVTTLGGKATGSVGIVSYTVGQVAFTTNNSISGTVTQGVQQPYEIMVVTELEEAIGIILNISIYPNPASDFLMLKVDNYTIENLICHMYDINGSLIRSVIIVDKETFIYTGNLIPATYYLKVSDNQKEIKTFKIIKN